MVDHGQNEGHRQPDRAVIPTISEAELSEWERLCEAATAGDWFSMPVSKLSEVRTRAPHYTGASSPPPAQPSPGWLPRSGRVSPIAHKISNGYSTLKGRGRWCRKTEMCSTVFTSNISSTNGSHRLVMRSSSRTSMVFATFFVCVSVAGRSQPPTRPQQINPTRSLSRPRQRRDADGLR